jgi:hypothetical protein
MTSPLVPLLGLLCILGLAVPALLLGRAVLGRLRFDGGAEVIALSMALGLGLLSHLLLLLGLLRLLRTPVTVALLVIVSAGSIAWLRRIGVRPLGGWMPRGEHGSGGGSPRPRRTFAFLLVAVVGVALAPYLLISLYPPTAFDATMYHLAAAKEFAQQGAVVVVPNLRFPVYTFGVHVLYTALLELGSDLAPALLSTLASALVALLLVAWGRAAEGWRTGLAAGLLWLASPIVLYVSTIPYLDTMLTLFVTSAGYCFWRWHRDDCRLSLALSGAFVGLACGVKYTGLFELATLGILLLVLAARRPKALAAIATFGVSALAAGAPWYIRSAWLTGNPTWPFLASLFGAGPYWTSRDLADAWADLRTPGMGHDVKALLALPWNLFAHGTRFYASTANELSRAIPLALPLVLVGGATLTSGWVVLVLLSSLVLSWFLGSQVLRYLLPALPIYCLLAAYGFTTLLKRIALRRRPPAATAALVVLAVLLPLRVARVGWGQLRSSGPPPLTDADRERYLSSSYPAYRALLAAPQDGGAVYSLFGSSLAYYSPARFAGDWFGPWPYRTVLAAARSGGRDLHALLTTWGYEYLHVARNRMFSQANAAVPEDEEFRRLFQVVYADEHAELYRLLQEEVPPSPEVQLLRNSGFERLDDADRGAGWGTFGSPRFDSTGAESRSGKAAVLVDQRNTIYQPVAVEPNGAYRLRMFARAASGPGAVVRLQLNWTDQHGKPAGLYLRPVKLADGWVELTAVCRAPGTALRATVYGSCHEECGAGVWIDDLTLSEIQEAPLVSSPWPKGERP